MARLAAPDDRLAAPSNLGIRRVFLRFCVLARRPPGFASRTTGLPEAPLMEEIAQVYSRSLFEVAKEQDKLDVFLDLLVEKHRMPTLFRIRRQFEERWQEENRLLPVQVTSAIELDDETVEQISSRIAEQTDRKIELSTDVNPEILGGIVLRVGNSILDASIRNRLEQVRRQLARA